MKSSVSCSGWFFPGRGMANLTCSIKRSLWYLPTHYTLPSIPSFAGFFLKLTGHLFFLMQGYYSSYAMIFACDTVSQICDNLPTLEFIYLDSISPLDKSLGYFVSTSDQRRTKCWQNLYLVSHCLFSPFHLPDLRCLLRWFFQLLLWHWIRK